MTRYYDGHGNEITNYVASLEEENKKLKAQLANQPKEVMVTAEELVQKKSKKAS